MSGQRFGRRHMAQALLTGVVLSIATPVVAGLLTTDRTLADFSFVGGEVDYAPDPKTVTLPTDAASAFMVTDPDLGYGGSDSIHDTLRGALHISTKAANFGNFIGSDFNVFGSLPALATQPEAVLAADAVKALKPDSKPGGLEFLIDRDLIVGRLASQYRGAGIFMLVAGVDEETWVRGFADGAAAMKLLSVEDAVANGTAPASALEAVPLPGTLGLLVAGLPWLRRRRRAVRSVPGRRLARAETQMGGREQELP